MGRTYYTAEAVAGGNLGTSSLALKDYTYHYIQNHITFTNSASGGHVQCGSKGTAINSVLDLRGKTINRNLSSATENGYCVFVNGGSTLRIDDTTYYSDGDSDNQGKITGGYDNTTAGGSGIRIGSRGSGDSYSGAGTVHMACGLVAGNKHTRWGAGVAVNYDSDFYMYYGRISDNHALGTSNGGGAVGVLGDDTIVYNQPNFYLFGGTIANNEANAPGGAVLVKYRARFNMYGGTIGDTSSKGSDQNYTNDTLGAAIALESNAADSDHRAIFHLYAGTLGYNYKNGPSSKSGSAVGCVAKLGSYTVSCDKTTTAVVKPSVFQEN